MSSFSAPFSSRLPPELIWEILGNIQDQHDSHQLRQCCLVCRAFADICQPPLFFHVSLYMEKTEKRRTNKSNVRLLNAINKNPKLAGYVKRIELSGFESNKPSAKYDAEVLPQILKKLNKVQYLQSISETSILFKTPAMESALFQLVRLPTFQTLDVVAIQDLSCEFLLACSNLKNLFMLDCFPRRTSRSTPAGKVFLENLEYDTQRDGEVDLYFLRPDAPFDLSRLKSLVIKEFRRINFNKLSERSGSSLETLVIDHPDYFDETFLGDFSLGNLKNLSSLTLQVDSLSYPPLMPVLGSLPFPKRLKALSIVLACDDDDEIEPMMKSLAAYDQYFSRFSGVLSLKFRSLPADQRKRLADIRRSSFPFFKRLLPLTSKSMDIALA